MKVLTILGTRPEIIRLSKIIPKLDKVCDHVLVHTGQSYDTNMSQVFFDELGIRVPDRYLDVKSSSFGIQVAKILRRIEDTLRIEQPDKVLILGDTNSALSAFIAKRMGIRVYHMEAGNRCYDDKVPEEVNRRLIDHASDILMPYTERSRSNLLAEGIPNHRIYVTGNPIHEVLKDLPQSDILDRLDLVKGKYILVTAHREENVDNKDRLRSILDACSYLGVELDIPVIFSRHPRTASRMKQWDYNAKPVRFYKPFGLLDFKTLEQNALLVITDSGTVGEECCLFRVPVVIIRDSTERIELLECGSAILAGVNCADVIRAVVSASQMGLNWDIPEEYQRTDVSDVVVKLLMGC